MPHVYYKVRIIMTAKKPFSQEEYHTFDKNEQFFPTLEKAKEFIKEQYKNVKRVKMFVDTNDGKTISKYCGWIYCFKNKDWSHASKWRLQQDWVEISKIDEEVIL